MHRYRCHAAYPAASFCLEVLALRFPQLTSRNLVRSRARGRLVAMSSTADVVLLERDDARSTAVGEAVAAADIVVQHVVTVTVTPTDGVRVAGSTRASAGSAPMFNGPSTSFGGAGSMPHDAISPEVGLERLGPRDGRAANYAGHPPAVACPPEARGARLHNADANGPPTNGEARGVGASAGRVGTTATDQPAPFSPRHECGEAACPADGMLDAGLAPKAVVGDSRSDGGCVGAATSDPAPGVNSPVGHGAVVGRSGGADSGGAPFPAEVDRGLTDAGNTPGDAEASTPSGPLDAWRCVPLPLVRKLSMHMDSCPSTNKSHFFTAGSD